jgi:two-component system, NtrC family, nitrogen regulation response regulator GlnG
MGLAGSVESEATIDSGSVLDWRLVGEWLVPALTVLAHPEPRRVGERTALWELAEKRTVELSRDTPLFTPPNGEVGQPLADRYLTRRPLRLIPGAGGAQEIHLLPSAAAMPVVVDGRLLAEPLALDAGRLADGVVLLLAERVALLLHLLEPPRGALPPRFGLVGDGNGMTHLRQTIQWASLIESPVLLLGETGTGKELVARALHDASPRRRRPFQAVNLGALPPTLAAAELFGATRGAYTGADQARTGFFEQADGGTLFLDEIGEAPREVQAALLRTLETGEVQPVGGGRARRVDVRLVAATDRDLDAAIDDGSWSSALLHRLAGWEIRLPPLRQRRDDVGRLLHHFLRAELERLRGATPAQHEPSPPPARLVAALARYDWPGNVRELRNVARELALTVAGIATDSLGPRLGRLVRAFELRRGETADARTPTGGTPRPATVSGRRRRASEIGHEELVAVLEAHRFHLKAAAEALGISRTTLYQRITAAADLHLASDLADSEIAAARAHCGGDLDATAAELRVSADALRRRLGRRAS